MFTKLNDTCIHIFNRFNGHPSGSSTSSCMNALLSIAIQSSVFDLYLFSFCTYLALDADMGSYGMTSFGDRRTNLTGY